MSSQDSIPPEQYQLLFDHHPQPMWVYDIETLRFLAVNEAAVRHYGYSRDDFLRMTLREIRPPEDVPMLLGTITNLSEGLAFGEVWRHQKADGTIIEVEVVAHQLDFNERRARLVMLKDVTARRQAEERLRESEARFRQLAENIEDVFWITDPRVPCVLYVSPAFEEVWGYSRQSAYNDYNFWIAMIHPDDRKSTSSSFFAHAKLGLFDEEYRIVRPDGSLQWIRDRGFPVRNEEGEVYRIAGIAEDITERKRIESERDASLLRERAARLEAEDASRLKDEFLATLSHELRTPLTSIMGWSRLLSADALDDAARVRALTAIGRNADSQAKLIEDLLDVSRAITGKLRLNSIQLELSAIIEAALEGVRPASEAKGIKLRAHLSPSVVMVTGDADRLRQVVWNLLTNAIKFTPCGGRVEVGLETVGSHASIIVSDTGQGISREFLPFVFDRFRQADGSTTRAHGGLGLGLAIVRHLTELHGGTVHAESTGEGEGATFTVRLPLINNHEIDDGKNEEPASVLNIEQKQSAVAYRAELDGVRALVVDDDAEARELMTTILEQYGATVVTAESAAAALKEIKRRSPDVLLSDIGMAGDDGYALIRKVRALEHERGGHIPAAALTAYAREEDRAQAIRSGFQMHIPKPVEPADLASAVVNLLGRGSSS